MFTADLAKLLFGRRSAQAVAILAALALGHQLVAVDIAVVLTAGGPRADLLFLLYRRLRRRNGTFVCLSHGNGTKRQQTESHSHHTNR
jgi:hypothetical protein